jgi:hypothetical protein
MHPRRSLLPVVLAVGVAAAAPATAGAKGSGPSAHAAGGDLPPIIPSLVQTRLTRAENALERLTRYVDNRQSAKVVTVGKVIRRQTAAAWRGAKYYLNHPPAPPAEDRAARGRRFRAKAKASGDGALPVIADPFTTAVAVFGLVHDVSAETIELTDGAHGNTLTGLSRTMFWTYDKRDAMVRDAHALEPPVPPEDRQTRSRSLKQDDATPTFATLMPEVTQGIDDELQHIDGLQSDATDLSAKAKSILRQGEVQILLTERTINTFWPPVPPED